MGSGFDVHALVEGRPLILGGIAIPHDKGLLGHSDADVLTHAICDALLGALGLGDIGVQFPDHDPQYKGICSLRLLERCVQMMQEQGYEIENLDATLIAQAPKMAPYREAMRGALCQALNVEAHRLNLKATTTEWLGFTGRGEGMAAQAVCLLKEAGERADGTA